MRYLQILVLCTVTSGSFAFDKIFNIYLDSDRSNHIESAQSIEYGAKVAFKEINNNINGHKFKFLLRDHRGNTLRSKLHMDEFLQDKNALYFVGGLHSPPIMKYLQFINENKILYMVPWAAGGPITRYNKGENWVYRLSVDDTKVGSKLVDYSVNVKQCKNPHLLLEKTGWGESNYRSISSAYNERFNVMPSVTWFNWNTKGNGAHAKLKNIVDSGYDCILLVGNSIETGEFVNAMSSLDHKVPIISHWGLTGGNFHERVPHSIRRGVDLSFVQSCFSFMSPNQSNLQKEVFSNLKNSYSHIKLTEDLQAPTGFIHSYDLSKIIISILKKIDLDQSIDKIRSQLREGLENMEEPVHGLIKTYIKPFTKFSKDNPDAHEALNYDDLCIGKYNNNDAIYLINSDQ